MQKSEYLEFHKAMCAKMIEITQAKNADYTGSGDDPFKNFRAIGNMFSRDPHVVNQLGFMTRMSDKMSRIASFIEREELSVKDESVEDTLIDLANYCILFAGYLRELKEKK